MLCKDPVCRRHNRSLLGSSSTVIRNQEGASWEVAVSFQETQHNFTIQIPPDGGRLGGHHCYGVHCKTTFINKRDASLNFFLSFFFYTFKSRLWLRQVTKKKKHTENHEAAQKAGSETTLCSITAGCPQHHELQFHQMISEATAQIKADS